MNPYSILGIPSTASQDEIRAAYRKIAKKHHPDLNPGNKDAEKKFKELNTANEILSDPEKRGKFDRGEIDETGDPQFQQFSSEGAKSNNQGPSYYQTQSDGGRYASAFGGVDSDYFEKLFSRRGSRVYEPLSQDEHYKMEVSFKDAAVGAQREIKLPTGKTIKVTIPAGIESGKKLRFKGAAESQANDHGDIYVEIQVAPSKLFIRDGNDIAMELPVTLYEAILGAEVATPTLESAVKLKIPPGSNTGTRLRLRGKGIAGNTPGDLIVTLKVILPSTVDPELEKLAREWSNSHPYNPRITLETDGGS